MSDKPLIKVDEQETKGILKAGGCPANNTTCSHLRSGACTYDKPDLYKREGGYACGSYMAVKTVVCPHCKTTNTVPGEVYKDIEVVGKVVVECSGCNKLFMLRDDGDGEYICS